MKYSPVSPHFLEEKTIKIAFIKSLPMMCSYLFVSMAYGMMMAEAGFGWPYSLLISMTVYTGAFQFVLISFLRAGTSLLTIGVTALLMNSRQVFYSITFLDDFRRMGKRKLYMIHTMTDETYAVNCSLELQGEEKKDTMFLVAFFSRLYWMVGAVLGGIVGQIIPWNLDGIDFCMTALFIIIFMDQWEKAKGHRAALTGLAVGIASRIFFGASAFMLPALLMTSGLLVLSERKAVEA